MLRWAGLLARLVVGGVWLWAGLLKISDPEASVTAVRGYQLLPASVAEVVGRSLPTVEVALGAVLVLGLLHRFAGALSALLQLAFIVGIASVWARGIAINCGCFGDGGPNPDAFGQYPWEIARDTGLLAASLLLVFLRRTAWSLDSLIAGDPHPTPEHQEDSRVEEVA
ncbi:MAG: DoxX family protein [Marmoricola sp.]|nr:DoxX family protein [Marmoricola sp.]